MELRGAGVTLRAMEKRDNELFKRMVNDPEVEAKVIGWSFPSSDEGQSAWYGAEAAAYGTDTHKVRYAVDVEGACVGMAGLHGIDYKNASASVDIKLAAEARGRGIGTAAIGLLVKYAFEELNLHCLQADILEGNHASRRAFEKSGFVLEGVLRERVYKGGRYQNVCMYAVLKEDYLL